MLHAPQGQQYHPTDHARLLLERTAAAVRAEAGLAQQGSSGHRAWDLAWRAFRMLRKHQLLQRAVWEQRVARDVLPLLLEWAALAAERAAAAAAAEQGGKSEQEQQ